MIWSILLRLIPALSRIVPAKRKLKFLLSKYDPDQRIYYASDETADYDNTSIHVIGHKSLPDDVSCLVQGMTDKKLVGIQAGRQLREHATVELPLDDVDDGQYEIRYFYKAVNSKFNSLAEAYLFIRSRRAARVLSDSEKYEPHLLADHRFADRMSILQIMAKLAEDLYADERTGITDYVDKPKQIPLSSVGLKKEQIINGLYDDYGPDVVVSNWPTYARLNHRLDMVLCSLIDSGELQKSGDDQYYFVAPKAFTTLTEHADRRTASNEAREQHRQIKWLRIAAIVLAIVGLIPTVIQPFYSWLMKLFS